MTKDPVTKSSADDKNISSDELLEKILLPVQPPSIPRISMSGCSENINPSVRIKEAPICRVPALRRENMSAKQLSEFCFSLNDVFPSNSSDLKESNSAFLPSVNSTDAVKLKTSPPRVPSQEIHRVSSSNEWASAKRSMIQRTQSRSGRDCQRYATDPRTGHMFRLTTGSVPIMKDGRILLISSSRKEEWILPKGGWESDEMQENSALRETYEEGGILGTLGPNLTDIEYETRKAKKKRLDLEMKMKKYESASKSVLELTRSLPDASACSGNSSVPLSEDENQNKLPQKFLQNKADLPSKDCLTVDIRNTFTNQNTVERFDDTASVASIASIASSEASFSCSHNRMSMYPLYVIEVREQWPESGRARKIVDIDKAIAMLAPRPEFQKVLIEVKRKGYHLVPPSSRCKVMTER